MGRVLDGQWVSDDRRSHPQGRFVRPDTVFRAAVTSDGTSVFDAEADRYHLYYASACPWCHRTLIARSLKGLSNVISISAVEPTMGQDGWVLADHAGPVPEARTIWQVYVAAERSYTGRATVPILWDKGSGRIVNNESLEIMQMFDSAFDEAGGDGSVRLFPDGRRDEILAMIQSNYEPVNNGVYRAGFAGSQEAHTEAVRQLFARLDELEQLLANQRYLVSGDEPTAADWCLFPTLFRFDTVYHTHFKCNRRHVYEYPNLWAYTRDLYQMPGVRETCELTETAIHYYTSHETVHPRGYVPIGPTLDFDEPHGRS